MVTSRPFEGRRFFDGRSSTWEWLDHGYVDADVLVRIVDAAKALAELALHAGENHGHTRGKLMTIRKENRWPPTPSH